MAQYGTYLSQVRLLLHDPNGNGWSDATLTGYINEARRRVCKDTYCVRDLATSISLVAGTERYIAQTVLTPSFGSNYQAACSINGIDLYYGNSRYPLTYMPWRRFSLQLRYWQNLQQLPVAWSRIGANVAYVGPIPDQNYTTDWDVSYIPVDLTSNAQTEIIPEQYVDVVQWWAARLAKVNEQALGEADFFEKEYWRNIGWETAAFARFQYTPR